MDYAKCVQDDIVYSSTTFDKVSDFDIKKRYLICKECGAPAYFRKASKSGQAACFGARPHKDHCSLGTLPSITIPGVLQDTVAFSSSKIIQIERNGNSKKIFHITEEENQGIKNRNSRKIGSRHIYELGTKASIKHRNMKKILKNLIIIEEDTKKAIFIINNSNIFGKDLFKKYNEITETDIKKFRGLYGKIHSANYGKNDKLWINFTRDQKDPGIAIPNNILDFIVKNNKFTIDEFEDKYVLAFGIFGQSPYGKLILNCKNAEDITIINIKN